jgi:HEAT repeat protein
MMYGRVTLAGILLAALGCDVSERTMYPDPRTIDWDRIESIDFENPTEKDIPVLISLFADHPGEILQRAYVALQRIGEPAIPALVENLRRDRDLRTRFIIRESAIGRMGPAAIPKLLEVIDDPRYFAGDVMFALARCRPTTKEAVATLLAYLRDDNVAIRLSALESLSRMATEPDPPVIAAVPDALAELIKVERDRKLRGRAEALLARLNHEIAMIRGRDAEYGDRGDEAPKTR